MQVQVDVLSPREKQTWEALNLVGNNTKALFDW